MIKILARVDESMLSLGLFFPFNGNLCVAVRCLRCGSGIFLTHRELESASTHARRRIFEKKSEKPFIIIVT